MFPFTDLFPPKDSMKEFMENRGRQDETGSQTSIAGISRPSGPAHLSNIDIVVAILPALQTFLSRKQGRLRIRLVQTSFFDSFHPPSLMPRWATALNFVIPTGADLDFLDRKSRGA
jgi:hypothetical protein